MTVQLELSELFQAMEMYLDRLGLTVTGNNLTITTHLDGAKRFSVECIPKEFNDGQKKKP